MSRINKKSKLTNTNNILIIIIGLLLLSLFIYVVLNKYKKKIYKFENTENSTINENNNKSCSAVSDIVDFCIDYDNCCSRSNDNNKCFCDHPFTKSCKDKYDVCMNDPNNISSNTKSDLLSKCKLENSNCCKEYNNIPISSSNFGDQLYRVQTDSIICNIPLIKNIEQKCLEMCQTNPNCAAYSISRLNCNLYNTVSEYQPKLDTSGNEITNTSVKFFIKNVT